MLFRAVWACCLLIATSDFVCGQQTPPFPKELVDFESVRATPVFSGGGEGEWDAAIRERGWILKEKQRFRMWYTGYDGSKEGIRRLGYAESKDGVNWQRRSKPLIADLWVEDMIVVPINGEYLMFAEGKNDQAQLLRSIDGIDWKRVGRLDVRLKNGKPIPAGPYGTPTVWFEKGTWHLFYERRDAGIWLATSKDLKVWTNVSDEPVMKLTSEPHEKLMIAMNQIVKTDGWYYAYYHGTGSSSKPRKWCTCIAASRDLIHWTKYSKNPLLPLDENKSSGIVVDDNGSLKLFTMHGRVVLHQNKK